MKKHPKSRTSIRSRDSPLSIKAHTRFSMVKSHHRCTFETALEKDKMDPQLISLCQYLSRTSNYYTASGCSGRIVLLDIVGNETDKRNSFFHFKEHRVVEIEEIWDSLNQSTQGRVWFKCEPFILHIGTDSLEHAQKILRVMKDAGIRRGGIMAAKEGKFIVEFQGSQGISFPVKEGTELLAEKEYLEKVLELANTKLEKNYTQLKRLESLIRTHLK